MIMIRSFVTVTALCLLGTSAAAVGGFHLSM